MGRSVSLGVLGTGSSVAKLARPACRAWRDTRIAATVCARQAQQHRSLPRRITIFRFHWRCLARHLPTRSCLPQGK